MTDLEIANSLKDSISAVEAIKVTTKTGKASYRVEIVLADGTREIIKKKGTRAPTAVQLYNRVVNGNARVVDSSAFFTFAKSVDSWYRDEHLKSYPVTLIEDAV